MPAAPLLSIGEVLAELLEEFPDVTISKIRFLENQGLIEPQRTPSGYRQFTEHEVERLRVILREQKAKFLPLRVIKDRLDDETSDISKELRLVSDGVIRSDTHPAARAQVPRGQRRTGSAARGQQGSGGAPRDIAADRHAEHTSSIPRDELIAACSLDPAFLGELEQAGLVRGHVVGDTTFFEPNSAVIVRIAARFAEMGIDVRHLRAWRSGADREMSLFEQRILPFLRSRDGRGRDEAIPMLEEMVSLGGELRSALLDREVARLSEQR